MCPRFLSAPGTLYFRDPLLFSPPHKLETCRMNIQISTSEQQMLSLICNVFDAYTVTLFLPAGADGTGGDASEEEGYVLAAWFSLGDNVVAETRIRNGQGLVGWIVDKKKFIEIPAFDQHEGGLLYYGPEGDQSIKAFMGCPLPSGGALCVDTKRQYGFTEKEHRHLQMFATILDGVHTQSSFDRSISEIPLYFSKLRAITELVSGYKRWDVFISGFLNCVAAATGFDYCAFASVEVPGESYCIAAENQPVLVHNGEPFFQSISYGLAGWVFRNGQDVVQDGEEGRTVALFGTSENLPAFTSVACLPVFINRSPRACLCLGHTQPHVVSTSMRAFLREAVTLLSMHAEVLYLRNRLRSFMQSATVYHSGPRSHDPDRDPYQPVNTSADE